MGFTGTRVLILAHVKELLEQGADGLKQLYPEADFGFYSASIGQKVIDRPNYLWRHSVDL
jgi:DNA repair protein RadD